MAESVTLEITEAAESNISAMLVRVGTIGATYGESSPEYKLASDSLLTSLAQVLRLGGRITAEDDLSLYCVSFIHYGVVFHAKRNSVICERCGGTKVSPAGHYSDGTAYPESECNSCYGEAPGSYQLVRDQLLGEWSVHS